ncbi:helix-turn-helix domain-containing protein [Catenulispora yoronensis]
MGREVRRRRRLAGLTMQGLADAAGLSRRGLSQIEQGDGNPSLVTVDKIARALGTDFAGLVTQCGQDPLHVSEPVEVWRGPRDSRAVLQVPSGRAGGPELWEWTLGPGQRYQGEPDPAGSEELILVLDGSLSVEVEGRATRLEAGAAARLLSDREYAFAAGDADVPTRFIRVVDLREPA